MDTKKIIGEILDNVSQVIVGKEAVAEKMLVAMLAEGHVLLEDVPGVGKTTLAKAFAKTLDLGFRRIQFTPDLMPSDITGISIYNQKSGEFEFKIGPIMAQVILADEINRTSPKTQASLLEAMEERQVTVDGNTIKLPKPFMVIATQNPIEYEGTFPLPEAQIDRFLLKLSISYPNRLQEKKILRRFMDKSPIEDLLAIAGSGEIEQLQAITKQIFVDESIDDYIVEIVEKTRNHKDLYLGASPRASLALFKSSQALALIRGRNYVIPDDIKEMVMPVLCHRLILKPEVRMQRKSVESIISEILSTVTVPVVKRNDK
jgi:MoxR-like ATPase